MRTVTRTEGILPALETAHARRGAAEAPRRGWRARRRGSARAPRPLRPRRQGPRGVRSLTWTWRRVVSAVAPTLEPSRSTTPATNDTAGARRIAAAFAVGAGGRAGSRCVPLCRRRVPGRDDGSFGRPLRGDRRAGRTSSRSACPYSDPLADGATLQRASHVGARSPARPSMAASGAGRAGRGRAPGAPLVTMGYANQLIGGGDGRDRAVAAGRGPAPRASSSPTSRRTRARPFEAVAAERRPRGRLPRRADDLARPAGRDRRPERRLPLLRQPRRGHRRPDQPAAERPRRSSRDVRAVSPVPVAVGFGVSPARPRPRPRQGRRGRRDRRLGAGRCPRAGRHGRRADGPARRDAAGRDGALTCGDDHARRRRPRGDAEADLRQRHRLAGLATLRQDRGRGARGAPRVRRPLRDRRAAAGESTSRRRASSSTSSRPATGRRRHRLRRARAASPTRTAARPPRRRPSGSPGSWRRPGRASIETAAAAPEALRKGPRGGGRDTVEDRRPRRSMPTAPMPTRDRRSAARPDAAAIAVDRPLREAMLDVLRLARPTARRSPAAVDRPLRGPPDRLARPRPRLGDRGPVRAGESPMTRRADGTDVAQMGRPVSALRAAAVESLCGSLSAGFARPWAASAARHCWAAHTGDYFCRNF